MVILAPSKASLCKIGYIMITQKSDKIEHYHSEVVCNEHCGSLSNMQVKFHGFPFLNRDQMVIHAPSKTSSCKICYWSWLHKEVNDHPKVMCNEYCIPLSNFACQVKIRPLVNVQSRVVFGLLQMTYILYHIIHMYHSIHN